MELGGREGVQSGVLGAFQDLEQFVELCLSSLRDVERMTTTVRFGSRPDSPASTLEIIHDRYRHRLIETNFARKFALGDAGIRFDQGKRREEAGPQPLLRSRRGEVPRKLVLDATKAETDEVAQSPKVEPVIAHRRATSRVSQIDLLKYSAKQMVDLINNTGTFLLDGPAKRLSME
jgi:hypothetical protein